MAHPPARSRVATALVVLGYLCLAAAALTVVADVFLVWPQSSRANLPSILIAVSMVPQILGLTCGGVLMLAAAEALACLRRMADRLEESAARRES